MSQGAGRFRLRQLNTTTAPSPSAADIDVPGAEQRYGTTTITSDANQTIGLGRGAGTLQLSQTELTHITVQRAGDRRQHDHRDDGQRVTTGAQQGPVTLNATFAGADTASPGTTSSFLSRPQRGPRHYV